MITCKQAAPILRGAGGFAAARRGMGNAGGFSLLVKGAQGPGGGGLAAPGPGLQRVGVLPCAGPPSHALLLKPFPIVARSNPWCPALHHPTAPSVGRELLAARTPGSVAGRVSQRLLLRGGQWRCFEHLNCTVPETPGAPAGLLRRWGSRALMALSLTGRHQASPAHPCFPVLLAAGFIAGTTRWK